MTVSARRSKLLAILPHLVIVAAMLHGVAGYWSSGTGLTGLVHFGDQFADTAVPELKAIPHAVEAGSPGYDGQFYAQLAFDPLLRNDETIRALDNPPYRARRVMVPAVAYAVGLGQPRWILTAYTFVNIVCWLLFAGLLFSWMPPGRSRSFAAWTGCVLANGWIASITLSLVDGPALLLLALGVFAVDRAWKWGASMALAVAVLGRETNVLGAVAALPRRPSDISGAAILRVCTIAVPFILWVAYLETRDLGSEGPMRNVALPFVAFVEKWFVTLDGLSRDGWESWERVSLVAIVGMTVQAAFLLTRWRWTSPWWRIGAVHAVFMLVLGPPVWEGIPGAATRVMLPLATAFNVELLGTGRWFWPLWIAGNVGILLGSQLVPIPFVGSLI